MTAVMKRYLTSHDSHAHTNFPVDDRCLDVAVRSANAACLITGPTTAREAGAETLQARRAALLDTLGSAGEDSGQSDSVEFAVEALVALKQDRSVSAGSLVSVTSRRRSQCAAAAPVNVAVCRGTRSFAAALA